MIPSHSHASLRQWLFSLILLGLTGYRIHHTKGLPNGFDFYGKFEAVQHVDVFLTLFRSYHRRTSCHRNLHLALGASIVRLRVLDLKNGIDLSADQRFCSSAPGQNGALQDWLLRQEDFSSFGSCT